MAKTTSEKQPEEINQFDSGRLTARIFRHSGRYRDFLSAVLSNGNCDAMGEIEQPIADLEKIAQICDMVAADSFSGPEKRRASLWKPVLLGTEFIFVGISVYASINGLNIFNAAWFNGVTAAAFSVLSLGLFNVTVEALQRSGRNLVSRCVDASKTGFLWLAFSLIPGIGSYIFLQEIQRSQDETGKADLELTIWENERSDKEQKIRVVKESLPKIDETNLSNLIQEYQKKTSELNAPVEYKPDTSRLEYLQSVYQQQLKETQAEASTGIVRDGNGMVSGRYGGKLQVLKDIETQVAFEKDRLSNERADIESRQIKAREAAIAVISKLIDGERDKLREAHDKRRTSSEWQQLQQLEKELDAHMQQRKPLELSKQEAEEDKATITRLSETTGIPLNGILLALTLAIESGAYAAALGSQLARGREKPSELECVTREPIRVDNVEAEVVEGGWVNLVRRHRQKSETHVQTLKIKHTDLVDLKKAATAARSWCEKEKERNSAEQNRSI